MSVWPWAGTSMVLLAMLGSGVPGVAQEGEAAGAEGRHRIAAYTGNSWIPQGRSFETGKKQTIVAPVYGLDYYYQLSEKWAIGTMNDITLIRVAVETHEGLLLERENAILLSAGAAYEICPRFVIEVSAGVETDKNETLRVGRFGVEYAIPLPKQWELGLAANYVNKEVFDAAGLGLVISRRFGSTGK